MKHKEKWITCDVCCKKIEEHDRHYTFKDHWTTWYGNEETSHQTKRHICRDCMCKLRKMQKEGADNG